MECDVLVVGAGPAGSSAAAAAARLGAATLLVDAKARIGEQPHCGEFVPKQLFVECGLDRGPVVQSVEVMETCVISLRAQETRKGPSPSSAESVAAVVCGRATQPSPGYLIDRPRFDRDLAREAASVGALILSSVRVTGRAGDAWVMRRKGCEMQVRARLVIAADGALSSVASVLGEPLPEVLRGVQIEAPLVRPLDRTLVYLSREIVGGYGWLFPKGRVANVGLGVVQRRDVNPSSLLDRFVEWLVDAGMIRRGVLARSSGVIPISGPRSPLVKGNVIFCGDAAGLTHPITGAGIAQAVVSGEAAGRSAALALKSNGPEHLDGYEREVLGRYRGVLTHALAKRRLMSRLWDIEDFRTVCGQTWIGFHGYRTRVKSGE
ncbi:MAG: NAD(P)/FAD-dependent oxidoreductase [Desulfomonile sp.]|nr:NAD(P)/FAD-dependent oxidoreductase [Desulfomonile sp.]